MAAMPSRGSPTPVRQKPATAGQTAEPACWPMWTGKIRLPAPKNRPNSMEDKNTYSLAVSLRSMESYLVFI